MGRSNPWGDLVGRYRGRNHVCNISWISVKGCECGERGKLAFSHWLDASPLQHWSHYRVISQNVPIYLQQFPSYSNCKCKKSPFSRTAAHIFVSPGDAPATITQYIASVERQFNACQTDRSMYLSIFNSFRVIRCLSQCVSPKIAIFTTLLFSPGTPLGQSR